MSLIEKISNWTRPHTAKPALEFFKYLGPGLLVTVGFIDPGNWASNVAAGAGYGYALLWMVTLSTIMLVVLQHNVAHLGIATGLCLSEAASRYLRPFASRGILISAMLAAVSTALAELLGAAIGLHLLFPHIPLVIGVALALLFVGGMLLGRSYRKIERWIIAFVSIIGISFLFELHLVQVQWPAAAAGWVVPAIPSGALPIVMAVLGAVVMPHNLFLHSEIIQSRQWNLEDDVIIRKQLNYEYLDTLVAMIIGWAINSAMILLAAATFFTHGTVVNDIAQASHLLHPLLGSAASIVFALALLVAGLASSVTAGMAGGSIFAGIWQEPYNSKDHHTRLGIGLTLIPAALIILLIGEKHAFMGLIISQVLLSVQLPITIFTQIRLTSSQVVMGTHANPPALKVTLWIIGLVVTGFNVALLWDLLKG